MGTHLKESEGLIFLHMGVQRAYPHLGLEFLGSHLSQGIGCQGSHHHLGWGFSTYPHPGLEVPGFSPLPGLGYHRAHHHSRSRSKGAHP